jgi:putative heme-binding domain-containing protein
VLAGALADRTLPRPIAALGLRKASSSGRPVPALEQALMKAGGLGQMTQQLTSDEMAGLIDEVRQSGDPVRGEAIYRRASLTCTVCHAIAGGGGKVGPDLVSLGASAPVDYIIESLLEPSKKIKEGYHMTVVTTKDSQVISGGLVRETDRELVIRDASDKAVAIPVANVRSKVVVPASLMPPGLTASLRRDEFVDLVRFMSELGKDGSFKAPAGRFVRNWQVLLGSPEIGHLMSRTSVAMVTTDDPVLQWRPAAATVTGELPLEEMPPSRRWESDFGAARFAIEVTTPGQIGLRFNDPTGLQMWHDSDPLDVKELTVVDLPAGAHRFTLAVNLKQRAGPVRIEVVDLPGSNGRAQPGTP